MRSSYMQLLKIEAIISVGRFVYILFRGEGNHSFPIGKCIQNILVFFCAAAKCNIGYAHVGEFTSLVARIITPMIAKITTMPTPMYSRFSTKAMGLNSKLTAVLVRKFITWRRRRDLFAFSAKQKIKVLPPSRPAASNCPPDS